MMQPLLTERPIQFMVKQFICLAACLYNKLHEVPNNQNPLIACFAPSFSLLQQSLQQ